LAIAPPLPLFPPDHPPFLQRIWLFYSTPLVLSCEEKILFLFFPPPICFAPGVLGAVLFFFSDLLRFFFFFPFLVFWIQALKRLSFPLVVTSHRPFRSRLFPAKPDRLRPHCIFLRWTPFFFSFFFHPGSFHGHNSFSLRMLRRTFSLFLFLFEQSLFPLLFFFFFPTCFFFLF